MSDKGQFALVASKMAEIENLLSMPEESSSLVFQSLLQDIAKNTDQCAVIMGRLEKTAEYYRERAAEFAKEAQKMEKAESYLRQMVKDDMMAHGVTELAGSDVKFKLINSKAKLVIDEKELDSAYIMHVPQPDKKRIEEDLKLNVPVKGARLEEVKALRTYINKKVD